MCTVVWMRHAGRVVELGNVRDFTRAVGALVEHHDPQRPRSQRPIRKFATHCLCPIDIEASAKAGGWELGPTDGFPDYMLRRPKRGAR